MSKKEFKTPFDTIMEQFNHFDSILKTQEEWRNNILRATEISVEANKRITESAKLIESQIPNIGASLRIELRKLTGLHNFEDIGKSLREIQASSDLFSTEVRKLVETLDNTTKIWKKNIK